MEAEGSRFVRKHRWVACLAFRHSWDKHKEEIKPFVRSFSGWTRQIFGYPDVEFLGGNYKAEHLKIEALVVAPPAKRVFEQLYDIYNTTKTPRIIHDGIEGSQKAIYIKPSASVSEVRLAPHVVDLLLSYKNDLLITPLFIGAPTIKGVEVTEPVQPAHYPLCIAIPAWSEAYVNLATQYTIPAVLASLKY